MKPKRILGLDLGTNSIGWALVEESASIEQPSKIVKLGVRVNPLTTDEKNNFEAGKPLSTNADRTTKRGARRNLQRYKLRRENLIQLLIEHHLINKNTPLTEIGKGSTYETLSLRAKATKEKISLEEFARVLLAINKKRGYKSSRKVNNEEEGQAIDGMAVAKKLYDEQLTPGQYVYSLLSQNKKYVPDFYRSDLKTEFDKVWHFQKQFYPEILSDELYKALQDKNKTQTWAICKHPFQIEGITLKEKGTELKKKKYELRSLALSEQFDLERLAIVLQEINNNLNQSSGYLGAISDRSKELYFNKETVGEYLWKQIQKNPHTSLKNQVFYRQDYLDEFEQIWATQAKFHSQLTDELKEQVRDVVIFYQRKLKSQKGLLSFCQFESQIQKYTDPETGKEKKRTIGRRVAPKSSPLFQEFKIWQNLANLTFEKTKASDEKSPLAQKEKNIYVLNEEDRQALFEELNLRGNLSQKEVFKFLGLREKEWRTNFPQGIQGNRTNAVLMNAYKNILEAEGYAFDWEKKTAPEIKEEIKSIFSSVGINPEIIYFKASLEDTAFEMQPAYQLWHLLYATEEDDKISEEDKLVYGNSAVRLKKKLVEKFGFTPEQAKWVANVPLQDDYGNLSTKAMRNIIPYLEAGHEYSDACELAGYNHSNSLTKEENENRELKEALELLPKNSLRNPVVEKILNQMANVVNQIIAAYGKPDKVRIELARELKKSAQEREKMTKQINAATKQNEEYRKILTKEFGIPNPTRNDVIRYRLWLELENNAFKDIFSNKQIKKEDLFSSKIDIEHIIPKALLYDDSFSNKTLAFKDINLKKANRTGYDFISEDYHENLDDYVQRVEMLYNGGAISRAKKEKLLKPQKDLSEGFIERDLRNTQYIAKKAKNMLLEAFREVEATSGSVTDKLREDWGLINVMKELNLPKYKALGLTQKEQRFDIGRGETKEVEVITDWTKRNDHRHHAMDALTVAFTKLNHTQYLNRVNTANDDSIDNEKIIERVNGKKQFIPPMPHFRSEAKKHLEEVLVSIKNKNKVFTINKNHTKGGKNEPQKVKTPRGQLHKETVYGKAKVPMSKPTKISKKFPLEQAKLIINPKEKEAVLKHLALYDNDPQIAFDTKTLKKNPLLLSDEPLKEVLCFEEIFTIRKEISPDLKIDKVMDEKIRQILKKRLSAYDNDAKKAFSDLDKNPIWLNEEKGICIKRVTITGVSNAEALHYQKDHLGQEILDEKGNRKPIDFVSTGNNHHIAIYEDTEGKLQEKVVSFFEAIAKANQGLPIIDKEFNKDLGWKFLFTMKQNEMFVFPNDDFDINEIDLLDDKNASLISKHLFRVQKIGSKDYTFRHHLETTVDAKSELKDIAYKRINSLEPLHNIKKVRINHIGKIVQVGEY